MAFDAVTGSHYNSTLFTLYRAYLLRKQLGDQFGQLVNVVVLWSALRRAAIREAGYYADTGKLAEYRTALFRRLVAGKLKGALIPLRRAEIMGHRLVERIERRSMSSAEREQRSARRQFSRQSESHRKLFREMPDIDHEVIQKGFGFLYAMVREDLPEEEDALRGYIEEVFNLVMRTFPQVDPSDERSEIDGTPYESDRWIMARVAEFIARANSVETARAFYRPILELGPAGKYWVRDFLQSWISQGLQVSNDLKGFANIWQDMVAYAETLPAWQPGDGNYWCPAEELASNLIGLSEDGIRVLGQEKHKYLVRLMAPTFERWGGRWLKFGSAAGWFAYFLRTESGQALLPQGVKQLATVIQSLPDRESQHDLGALFTEVLSLCWKQRQKDVEKDHELRTAFLSMLAILCASQIPEALHLRTKVSEVLGSS